MKEKLCPNYNNILKECELDEDKISKKIVQIYKTYVEKVDINEEDARNKLVRIDKIINSYFVDFKFKKELKEKILNIKVKEDGIDLLEFLINCCNHSHDSLSKLFVGSSIMIIGVFFNNARAIDTFCFSPPDNCIFSPRG